MYDDGVKVDVEAIGSNGVEDGNSKIATNSNTIENGDLADIPLGLSRSDLDQNNTTRNNNTEKIDPTASPRGDEDNKSKDLDEDDNILDTGRCGRFIHSYPAPVGDVLCWKSVRRPIDFLKLTLGWILVNKSQVLSGITVALAQVPEAVSFSFVAGVDPIVGLQSAWIMGICTSLGGGRPGMVAGSTGAIAVVLTNLVETYGIGHMFYAIMLAGLLQMIFGFLKLGVLVRMIPHPVMVGFCNGLGIVIGVAQFNAFKVPSSQLPDDYGADATHRNLASLHIGGAFAPFTNGRPWVDVTMGLWMTFHIVVVLVTYVLFPKLTKAVPASLAAIIVSTILEWVLVRQIGFATNTVEDLASVAGNFPVPIWVDPAYNYRLPAFTGQLILEVLPTALTAGIIGLLESLLTLQIIDELTNTKGSSNREAFGQGLGQFLSGMFGGMGGCTTIGQSLMNIHSGGYTRLSSSVAAFFMLLIILVAYRLINLIPIAALAGVMFVVTYFTIEWESGWVILGSCLPHKYRDKFGFHTKIKRSDVVVMLLVVAVTLILDLAIAVIIGILISCLIFAWDAGSRIHVERQMNNDEDNGVSSVIYTVRGPIFFGSVKPMLSLFADPRMDPPEAYVLLEDAEIYDWSGMCAIKQLHDRFENNGTTVHFQQLTVASHRLLLKGKKLWEDVNLYAADEDVIEEDILHDPASVDHMVSDNAFHVHL